MPIPITDFLDNKKLPTFIRNHKSLRGFGKVHKVFPGIGLPNCKEDCLLDNSQFVKASANNLICAIYTALYDAWPSLLNYKDYHRGRIIAYEKLVNIVDFGRMVYNLYNSIVNYGPEYIVENKGKVSIKIPYEILDAKGQVIFKAGESIFRAYNKLYNAILDLKCGERLAKLDTMPEFKRFSIDNLPNNKFQIVFSSDGVDGLWDIATMSMRGISSCQSWEGQYKKRLIGSIVDPFVGIIYLTSGQDFDKLGSKMIRRCIVRLAVNAKTKKAFIAVDRMYPEYDNNVMDLFLSFIRRRVGDIDVKFVFDNTDHIYDDAYIPNSDTYDKLVDSNLSYRDTKIPFAWEYEKQLTTTQKNIAAKQNKFRNHFYNTSFAAVSKVKTDNEKIAALISGADFKYLFRDYCKGIANKIIELAPPADDFNNSNEYMRKLCFFYISNKHLAKNKKTAFMKTLNSYYKEKINSKQLFDALKTVQTEIDSKIKSEIKKSFNKKPTIAKLP
jgi:hypothetical protein